MTECPVCGERYVSEHNISEGAYGLFTGGQTVTFDEIYYGPGRVCIAEYRLFAHGERL